MSKAKQHVWSDGDDVQHCMNVGCSCRKFRHGFWSDQRVRYAPHKNARPILKAHPCKGTSSGGKP